MLMSVIAHGRATIEGDLYAGLLQPPQKWMLLFTLVVNPMSRINLESKSKATRCQSHQQGSRRPHLGPRSSPVACGGSVGALHTKKSGSATAETSMSHKLI